jgi:N-methylhydantoinase A
VVVAGAAPGRIEVQVEIDTQRNRVCATASGATEIAQSGPATVAPEGERRDAAARAMRCAPTDLRATVMTPQLTAYERGRDTCVVDERGVVRLGLRDAHLESANAGDIEPRARAAIERATRFGDVGRSLPAFYLARDARIATFDGLASIDQAVALVTEELTGCDPAEHIALLTVPHDA